MRGAYFGIQKLKIIDEMKHTLIPELFPEEWKEILRNNHEPNNFRRPPKATKSAKYSTKKKILKPLNSKRVRSEFLEENRNEFLKMPRLDKEKWPKYIGSF